MALHFTVPDETTDHLPLSRKGVPMPLVAALCRVQGAVCTNVARLSVAPSQAVDTVDALPPALTVGPGRPVLYRVRVENPAGRDAGLSLPALAAAGAAPDAVTGLTATTAAQGVQLTWQAVPGEHAAVRVEANTEANTEAETASATAPESGKPPARAPRPATARLLQVPATEKDAGGAIDPAPAAGAHVEYRVYRERTVTVDGQKVPLRSQIAEVRVTRSADVFPPAAPRGLLAVSFVAGSGDSSVSLSWEPNNEPDVVGYRVYRAMGAGALTRVPTAEVAGVSFQDTAATGLHPGSHVRYQVTAVDRSGNESARSAVTEIDAR